jgi:hypothetical protein
MAVPMTPLRNGMCCSGWQLYKESLLGVSNSVLPLAGSVAQA